jgi:glutamate-1-semialdehyde aminotransferase
MNSAGPTAIHERHRAGGRRPSTATIACPNGGIPAGAIALEISSHNARVQAVQKRWDRLRAGLERILQQRGADMAEVPGGASGMLCRDYTGKEPIGW